MSNPSVPEPSQENVATTDRLASQSLAARRKSLEHALAHRPEAKDLEERHILQHGSAKILQKQHELEKAMTADQLRKHLARRPTIEELEARHILPENSHHVSPALLAHQKELERSMLEDSLKGKLAHRPAPEEVIKKGILTADEDPTHPSEEEKKLE
ncbi:hypothetical protein EX30DRAFT_344907 [Ascodesmis nigricans]|uniref:RPEL repeat protein n=1 Tax=Ascodesmis nigricans TaxID=341454 RepID=A0A4S2MI19_9PEZI|nr:hypothetical protein EX30DRAFT_344907 [Ascodesmis nigricans]